MAQALVSALLNQLSTSSQQEWRLLTGVEREINKVEGNLHAIHALLGDAEEKQMAEQSVRLWLHKVKRASYDLEDILDEWNTAFFKSKADNAGFFLTLKKKVLSLIFCHFLRQVCRRHRIAVRIKRINEELDEIAKEKDRYRLMKREIKQPRRVESTSIVDVSRLHGRDGKKKEIVSALLSENSMQTISIVGMGGLGKTALAQLIYNDDEVRKHFSKVIWVCVSDFFDQNKIARAILESLSDPNLPIPTSSLEVFLGRIREKITNNKFFLVLDDVWTERDEDWAPFKAIFRKGKRGSRVLVTTRKESVAVAMESFRVFHLENLSDEVSWLILSQVAFSGEDEKLCETLEDVGKEIAKKCKGLPLAAKTLGGLLRGKRTKDEWRNVLNSEFWRLRFEQEQDIFTPLSLSYYDLPPAIRPCFLYCVIFPKDYVMEKDELIRRWMAQGYLNCDGDVEMESVGEEYFNYLASRSLFQDFDLDGCGGIWRCKMHGMVYDFVKVFVKDEISSKVINGGVLDSISGNVRHLSIVTKMNEFPEFGRCPVEQLRSFVGWGLFDVSDEVLQKLINGAKYLRLLELHFLKWKGKHPGRNLKEIGKLIHLRYLDFSLSKIERLPEEVCELRNLQVLSVFGCSNLSKLPDGIGKLINLRCLITWGCELLSYYPKGIARLTSLRSLDFVRAEASKHPKRFCIGDLENLDELREELDLDLLGTNLDMEEVRRAKLHNKVHLKSLIIWLEHSLRAETDRIRQALNPPPNLDVEIIAPPINGQGGLLD